MTLTKEVADQLSQKQLDDQLKYLKFDPRYVQISRAEFAEILGRSITTLDRLRKHDPRCPKCHRSGESNQASVLYVLSECYEYSRILIADARKGIYPDQGKKKSDSFSDSHEAVA